MNVACTACPAKYAVPDDRVRGKRARITCKHCGTSIVVDGTGIGASEAPAQGSRPARKTMLGMGSPGARAAAAALLASSPPPADASGGSGGAWLVALPDGRREPASQARIVDLFAAGAIDANSYIWREGMGEWTTPFNVPEIAAMMRSRGLTPDYRVTNGPASDRGFDGQEEATQVGVSVTDMLRAKADAPQKQAPPPSSRRRAASDDDITIARSGPPSVPARMLAPGSPNAQRTLLGLPPPQNLARPASEPPPRRSTLSPPSQRPSLIDDFAIPLNGPGAPPPPPPPPPPPMAPVIARPAPGPLVAPVQLTPAASWPVQPAPSLVDLSVPSAAPAPVVANAMPQRSPDYDALPPRSGAPVALPLEYPFAAQRRRRNLVVALVLTCLGAAAAGAFVYTSSRPSPPPRVVAATPPAPAPTPEPPPAPAPEPPPVAEASASASASAAPEQKAPESKPAAVAARPAAVTRRDEAVRPVTTRKSDLTRAIKPADSEEGSETTEKPAEAPPAAAASEEREKTPVVGAGTSPFDREAAAQTLGEAALKAASCKTIGGPTGSAPATVTFSPNGRVLGVAVGGDFSGTLVGACIAKLFRAVSVPPFAGDPVTVTKRFNVE
jgi:predicted Zn finger-like uncharacterized protein